MGKSSVKGKLRTAGASCDGTATPARTRDGAASPGVATINLEQNLP